METKDTEFGVFAALDFGKNHEMVATHDIGERLWPLGDVGNVLADYGARQFPWVVRTVVLPMHKAPSPSSL